MKLAKVLADGEVRWAAIVETGALDLYQAVTLYRWPAVTEGVQKPRSFVITSFSSPLT